MENILKYLGVFIVIIGVSFLIIPSFTNGHTNTSLATGGIIMVVGLLTHIIINKYSKSE